MPEIREKRKPRLQDGVFMRKICDLIISITTQQQNANKATL